MLRHAQGLGRGAGGHVGAADAVGRGRGRGDGELEILVGGEAERPHGDAGLRAFTFPPARRSPGRAADRYRREAGRANGVPPLPSQGYPLRMEEEVQQLHKLAELQRSQDKSVETRQADEGKAAMKAK